MTYSTGILTGHYSKPDGTAMTGTANIYPSVDVVRDGDGNVILAGKVAAPLVAVTIPADEETGEPERTVGAFAVHLAATDDASLDPQGVTYSVRLRGLRPVTGISVLAGTTVDMADVTSVDPNAPAYAVNGVVSVAGLVGSVTAAELAAALSSTLDGGGLASDAALTTESATARAAEAALRDGTDSVFEARQAVSIDQRAFQVREAPLTPYRFGATSATSGVDNTVALAAMWAAAASATSPELHLPPGDWRTTGGLPLINDLTLTGAGFQRTKLTLAGAGATDLFVWNTLVTGAKISKLMIQTGVARDIFAPGASGGVSGFSMKKSFLYQALANNYIWKQDNNAAFIKATFEEVEMQRVVGSTVSPFWIRNGGGSANENTLEQVTLNGYNCVTTPFVKIESTLVQTYAEGWTFDRVTGEQNPAGLIHMTAPRSICVMNCSDEDASVAYVDHLFKFDANALGLMPRDVVMVNSSRRGSTLGVGVKEIYVNPGGAGVTLIACNPTPTSAPAMVTVPAGSTLIGMRRETSNVVRNKFGSIIELPVSTTAARPAASNYDAGAALYDTDLKRPVYGDTVAWSDPAKIVRAKKSGRRLLLSGMPSLSVTSGSKSLAKDTWLYMPLTVREPFDLQYVGVLPVTAPSGGTPTSVLRFALFAEDVDGLPGARQTDFTNTINLVTATTGTEALAAVLTAEKTIPIGNWFIGCAWTGDATVAPVLAPSSGSHPNVGGSSIGANHSAYSQAVSGGSSPSPAAPAAATTIGVAIWGVLL